ncbi:MAG: hypothetical protein II720_03950, partial [Bacteroidales bacterium]|nr:hypothetical protein [Bacteroidales bacterium]
IKLSAASSKDVKVKLAKADVQAGKNEVPADFAKNVTIKAGELSAEVYAEADVLGLESGEYQAAIKIASAEGAEVGDPSVVYIGYTFAFKPEVNLYGDSQFASDKKAKLKIALAKASTSDVKVKLALDPTSKAQVAFEKEATIPAGQTEKEIEVTVTVPDGLEPGIYPAIFKIESAENAEIGKSPSVTINLVYPFTVPITLDGQFDDWDNPAVISTSVPEGAKYPDMKVMKLAATTTHVYVYLEFTDPGFEIGRPFDLFVDHDGDPATGCILTSIDNDTAGDIFTSYGIRWYIELALHDGDHYNDFHSWGGIYKFDGTDGTGAFSGGLGSIGSYEATMMSAVGALEDGIGRIEIQMNRKDFGFLGTKARFGCKIMDGPNNWKALGVLPQAVDGGAFKPADMLTINLPAYAE